MDKKIEIQPRSYDKKAQIKLKIIDEAKKAARQQVVAYTPVVFNPELNPPTPGDAQAESGKKKVYKRIVKEAMLGEDAQTSIATKSAGSAVGKLAGKVGSKLIPGIGLVYNTIDAGSRAWQGDYKGAAISAASGVASLVPGVGTAASLGLDAYNMKRDYDADKSSNVVSPASAEPAPQNNSSTKPTQTTPTASNTPASRPTQVTPKPVAPASKPVQAQQQAQKPVTPAAKPANTTPAPSNDYKINKGDTLSAISKRSGVSVDQLAKDNNIKDVNKIYAGSNLKINKPSGVK